MIPRGLPGRVRRGGGRRVPPAALALLLACAASRPAAGGDAAGTDPVDAAAAEVVHAAAAHDDAGVARLAARDAPDAWLVVDRLLERGAGEAALRLAGARTDAAERAALEAYVGSLADPARAAAAARAREALRAARAAADPAAVLAATAALDPAAAASVPSVAALLERGRALEAGKRRDEGVELLATVADGAAALGWPRGAAEVALEAGRRAYDGSRAVRAIPLLGRAVEWGRRAPGTDLWPRALAALGEAHVTIGSHARALTTYAALLELGEARRDPAIRASALEGRASVRAFQRRGGDAVADFLAACELRREAGDPVARIRCLTKTAGTLVLWTDRKEEAVRLADEAVALLPTVKEPGLRSEVLSRRAILLKAVGRRKDARAVWEEVVALHRECGACTNGADALLGLADVDREEKAEAAFAARVAAARATLEKVPDNRSSVDSWERLGGVLLEAGQVPGALAAYEKAVAISRALGEPGLVARSLDLLSDAYEYAGATAERLRTLEALVALAEESDLTERLASALVSLAYVRDETGRREGALAVASRAAELARANDLLWDLATAERVLAKVHENMGNLTLSLEAEERAHDLFVRIGREPDVAVSLIDLSGKYRTLGRHAEAKDYLDRAIEIARRADAPLLLARALHSKAGLDLEATGDARVSIVPAREALAALGSGGPPNLRAGVLHTVGWHEVRVGQAADGVRHLKEAAVLTERMRSGLGDVEAVHQRSTWSYLWVAGTHAAVAANDPDAFAWFLEGGHAAALRDALARGGDIGTLALPEAIREQEAAARRRYRSAADAYRVALESPLLAERTSALERLEQAQGALERALDRATREARSGSDLMFVAPDSVAQMQKGLDEGDALVLYFLDEEPTSSLYPASALVLRRTSVRIVPLGSSRILNAACGAVVRADGGGVDERKLPFLLRRAVEPLELGPDVTRVLVSPSGRMGYVPLSLLFPGRDVAFVPSGTTLRVLREGNPGTGVGVLGAGDPAYADPAAADADPARHGGLSRGLARIPHTADEVRAVSDVPLLAEEATVPNLVRTIASRPRWRAVHLACHGLIDSEHPLFSSLALTPTKDHDGHLTALDVMGMRVPADLVVLSACETARGTQFAAEGVVGLMRAFMHAGAPRIVCSQWPVDDAATAALMKRFYALWNPKDGTPPLSAAAALRRAQEWVAARPEWAHPRFWAAWVLWGLPE